MKISIVSKQIVILLSSKNVNLFKIILKNLNRNRRQLEKPVCTGIMFIVSFHMLKQNPPLKGQYVSHTMHYNYYSPFSLDFSLWFGGGFCCCELILFQNLITSFPARVHVPFSVHFTSLSLTFLISPISAHLLQHFLSPLSPLVFSFAGGMFISLPVFFNADVFNQDFNPPHPSPSPPSKHIAAHPPIFFPPSLPKCIRDKE